MSKKLISVCLALLLCICLTVTVSAASQTEALPVSDLADLITPDQENALHTKLEKYSQAHDAQFAILTVPTTGGMEIEDYANHAYDAHQYGCGNRKDGVLLVVSMSPRSYWIVTNGSCAQDVDADAIADAIAPILSDGNYNKAFHTFADECDAQLGFDLAGNFILSLVIGLVAGLIVAFVLKGQLKSVRKQDQANVYVIPGSMHLTQSGDYFMYRTVSRVAKQQNHSSGGGRASRGGSGGRF